MCDKNFLVLKAEIFAHTCLHLKIVRFAKHMSTFPLLQCFAFFKFDVSQNKCILVSARMFGSKTCTFRNGNINILVSTILLQSQNVIFVAEFGKVTYLLACSTFEIVCFGHKNQHSYCYMHVRIKMASFGKEI